MFLTLAALTLAQGLFNDINPKVYQLPLTTSWPRTWVKSRFELDSNYLDSAKTIYFYFRIENLDIDLSGFYSGIKMNEDYSYSDCSLIKLGKYDKDWKATCEYKFSQSFLVYGPIDFLVAKTQTGTVIVHESTAGFFAMLEGPEPSFDNSLSVSFEYYWDNHYVSKEESLNFRFRLPDNSRMLPGDYFVVTPSFRFRVKEADFNVTMDQMLESSKAFDEFSVSLDYDIVTNDNKTQKKVAKIYVYGCSREIPGASEIGFTLRYFFNPKSAIPGNTFDWKIDIFRYGTNTLIGRLIGNGPSEDIVPGRIINVSWLPKTSEAFYESENIPENLEVYRSLKFTIEHDVPAFGKIVVYYKNASVNDYDLKTGKNQVKMNYSSNQMVFVSSNSSSILNCKIDSKSRVIITIQKDLPAYSEITLINYIKVEPGSSTIEISLKSMNQNNELIDELKADKSVFVTSSNYTKIISDAQVWIASGINNSNEVNQISSNGSYGLVLTLSLPINFNISDRIEVFLPFSNKFSSVQNNIIFQNNLWGLSFSDVQNEGFTNNTINYNSNPLIIVSKEGQISITNITQGNITNNLIIYIGAGSFNKNLNIKTPLFSLFEPLEVVIRIRKDLEVYYAATLLSFVNNVISPKIEFLCKNIPIDGNPVRISYAIGWNGHKQKTITVFKFSSSGKNISFLYDSGLAPGDEYPSSNKYLKVDLDGNLRMENTIQSSNKNYLLYIPILNAAVYDSIKLSLEIYAILKFGHLSLLYKGETESEYLINNEPNLNKNYDINSTLDELSTKVISLYEKNENSWQTYSAILILPAGFITKDLNFTNNSLESANQKFPYNVYFKETLGNFTQESPDYTLQIYHSLIKFRSDESKSYTFAFVNSENLNNNYCTWFQGDITTQEGKLTINDYNPKSVTDYNYYSRTSFVEFSFFSSSKIINGSEIAIELDGWSVESSKDFIISVGSKHISGEIQNKIWISKSINFDIKSHTIITATINNAIKPVEAILEFKGLSSINITINSNKYLSWKSSDDDNKTKTNFTNLQIFTQNVSNSKIWIFPNVPEASSVYFGLKFTAENNILSGTTVFINGYFDDNFELNKDLLCSHKYTSALIINGSLIIELEENISIDQDFEIILRNAFNIPKSRNVSNQIYVKVIGNDLKSTVLIDDKYYKSINKYKINSLPKNQIDSFNFESDFKYPGHASWYSFNISLSNNITNEFWVNFDICGDFNDIPGPIFNLDELENLIQAEDQHGNRVYCKIFFRIVSCYNKFEEYRLNIFIKLLLYNGRTSGWFNVYITDIDGNFIYQPKYADINQKVYFDKNIFNRIDLVSATSSKEGRIQTIELKAFIDIHVQLGDMFYVLFPEPYNLELSEGQSIDCNLTSYNSDGSINKLIKEKSCKIERNMVKFPIEKKFNFNPSILTSFKFYKLETPSTGFERINWNFESKSSDFSSHCFSVIFQDSKKYFSSSFSNLNAAFVEFSEIPGLIELQVNNGKDISIIPGTVCGPFIIKAYDGNIFTLNIEINIDNYKEKLIYRHFTFNNEGKYFVDYLRPSAQLFIGANQGTPSGQYYLIWNIKETAIKGESPKYTKPRYTIINVLFNKTHNIIFKEYKYNYHIYLSISIDSSSKEVYAYDNLRIYFFDDNSDLIISPDFVDLNSTINEKFILISCDDCINVNFPIDIKLIGNNINSFSIEKKIDISYYYPSSNSNEFKFGKTKITSTGISLQIITEGNTILTWALAADKVSGDYNLTYENLTKEDINSDSNNFEVFVNSIKRKYEKIFSKYKKYDDLMYNMNLKGNSVFIKGRRLINGEYEYIISVNCLVPKTYYTIVIYSDNFSGSPIEHRYSFRTADMPRHVKIELMSSSDDKKVITDKIAVTLGWNQKFIALEMSKQSELNLFSGYIYANPISTLSPFELIKIRKLEKTFNVFFNATEITSDDFTNAKISSYKWNNSSGIILYLSLLSNVNGSLKCIIRKQNNNWLSKYEILWQKFLSLKKISFYSEKVRKGGNFFNFDYSKLKLKPARYTINCILCNLFPGYPECSKVIGTNFEYKGKIETIKISSGMRFALFFIFIIL